LNEQLARQMLQSLKIYPLLTGYRGSKPVNIDKLIEVIIRLSYLAADYPEIEELDINPLLVTPDDVIALDARIVIDEKLLYKPVRDYSHLILRPYPERLNKNIELTPGMTVMAEVKTGKRRIIEYVLSPLLRGVKESARER
jgi:acetyltransferase